MKANKVLIIIQTVLMYMSAIMLLSKIFVNKSNMEQEAINQINNCLDVIYLFSLAILILLCLANILLGALSTLHHTADYSKAIMICKIIQIPWFIFNFIFCLLMTILMLQPFLLIAAPIFLILSVASTYLFMFSTSSLDVFLLAKSKGVLSSTAKLFSLIFLFFFILDVAGSILAYRTLKKEKETQLSNA